MVSLPSKAAKIPSGLGGGYGSGGYHRDDSQKKRKSRQVLPDPSRDDLSNIPYSPQQAAWEKKLLNLDAIDADLLLEQTDTDKNMLIIELLIKLNNSLGENREDFNQSVRLLLQLCKTEDQEGSAFVPLILKSFARYVLYFDYVLQQQLLKLLESLKVAAEEDEKIRFICDYLQKKTIQNSTKFRAPSMKKLLVIIAHPSTGLKAEEFKEKNIHLFLVDTQGTYEHFFPKFSALVKNNRHYSPFYALLPQADLWKTFAYVSKAREKLVGALRIYDTHSYGQGISSLIEEIAQEYSTCSVTEDVECLIDQKIAAFRHWLIPAKAEYLLKRRWFNKLMADKTDVERHKTPLLCLHKNPEIAGVYSSVQEALEQLTQSLINSFTKWQAEPAKIIIEFSEELEAEISEHIQQLSKKFSQTKLISRVATNKYLVTECGLYVAITVIL